MKAHIPLSGATLALFFALGAFAQAGKPTLQLVETFDLAPTILGFSPEGISRNGLIAGSAEQQNFRQVGFLLDPKGRELPLIFPTNSTATYANGVNSSGTVCGTYIDGAGAHHGWFYSDGVYTGFDVPGSGLTEINGINDAGDFCGTYYLEDFAGPFLDMGGTVIPIDLGDETSNGQATGISSNGLVTGIYRDVTGENPRAFIREADGTLITDIQVPVQQVSNLSSTGINKLGYVVGSYSTANQGSTGFVFRAPATFIFYNYPGAIGTYLLGINDRNQVVGYYDAIESDGMLHEHGVILQLQN